MRNVAPFATLLALVLFFTFASPSFATADNLANILTQISVTGVMAVGLVDQLVLLLPKAQLAL